MPPQNLAKCPFCGSTDRVKLMGPLMEPENEERWTVTCWKCEIDGPECSSDTKAIKVWNTRPRLRRKKC